MSKPQDIPQEVWDLAARFMERAYPYGAKEFAARAIMAAKAQEREACAFAVGRLVNIDDPSDYTQALMDAEKAIRARSKPPQNNPPELPEMNADRVKGAGED